MLVMREKIKAFGGVVVKVDTAHIVEENPSCVVRLVGIEGITFP
jgi:hypothetical protein